MKIKTIKWYYILVFQVQRKLIKEYNGNFDKNDYNSNIYYKIHDTTEIGATPINKTITFTTDNKTKEENIFIYKDGDWENFKKITIKRGCPKRAAFFMQQILGIDFSLVDL